jgi:cytochrome c peroxidase
MSAPKVELGRLLFFDPLLSGNGTQSCASCHDPARAFTDGRPTSLGSTGEATRRNAMSLVNVAYNSTLNWANPGLTRLEDQARIPLLGTDPVELGLGGREAELPSRLAAEPRYRRRFPEVFPEDPDPYTVERVVQALAAFQRTLISGDSPYDRYVAGDQDALSEGAKRGLELFFSERLECFHCHGGFNFAQSVVHAGSGLEATPFNNTGLYNVDGRGAYPEKDQGLFEITGRPGDMGRFRAPSLRNVAVTAPYMHDGSVETLDDAIDHYARGGREIDDGPYAGDGRRSVFKSSFVSGFRLTPGEREDLKAFLRSLTDEAFLADPRFQSPYD